MKAAKIVGDDHERVGQELQRHHLGEIGRTERDRDLGGQVNIGHRPQQLDGKAGMLAD